MIKKVLIATDGSEHARKAVILGSDLAAKYDAEVVLVHVLLRNEVSDDLRRMAEIEYITAEGGKPLAEAIAAVPAGRFPAFVRLTPEEVPAVADLHQAVGAQILKSAEKLAREHDVTKITQRVEDGKPVDRILKVAKDEGVDLIVSGARGLSDLAALMLGSTSHKLSQLAPVTCITVR